MLWRSSEQVLIQRGDSFLLLGSTGAIQAHFEPRSFSDEDDLWRTDQAVEGDRLIERTTVQHAFNEPRVYEEKVLATGLCPASDRATRALAEAGLAAHAAQVEQAIAAREREAAARVDAIPGARDELDAGAEVARAQAALRERVARWGDDRAAALLLTLNTIVRAKPDAVVIKAYVRGCLSACFAFDLPALPTTPVRSSNPALAKELAAHVLRLEQDAEGQEYADANRNAAAFWTAAKALRWAAACLE